jgi:DNA-binding response OmpR family regulator
MASPQVSDGILFGSRILVVEDEVLIAFDLRASFREAGAKSVHLAHTLADALALARTAELSSAMLDVRLGHDGAGPVAEVLKRRGIPFLFYSGQPPTDPVRQAWPDVPTLTKPAGARSLAVAIARLELEHPVNGQAVATPAADAPETDAAAR